MRTIARTLLVCVLLTSVAHAGSDWNSVDFDLYPGDFNGDSKTDLLYVAVAPNKESGIALSNGTQPVGRHQVWTSGAFGIPWHSRTYIPVVGDFNWDGRADIFMHRQTPGDHFLLVSNSDGTFSGISQTIANVTASLTWSGDQHRIISVVAYDTADPNHLRGHRLFLQAVNKGGSNALIATSFGGLIGGVVGAAWTDGYRTFQWNLRQAIVHSADFNGDGNGDLLIQAKPDMILIDYDIPIPVPRYRPQSFGIVYSPIGASSTYQMWDRITAGVDWSATQSNLTIGDFDGDGRPDVLVQPRGTATNTRLVLGNATTNQLTVASPVTVSFSGASSVGGNSVRIVAANFDGGAASGVYLQATSAGGSDLIAATLPSGGGSASTTSQSQQTQTPVTTTVGSLPGVADVSITGAGTYEIPLWVPPGTNNLQPELALAYSSQNGAGHFGAGWQLKGLSAIARCGKTPDQNLTARSVHNDSNDRLCLDGNQLKLFSGTYTAAGSEYRTEVETYSRIKAFGTAGTPQYFTVDRKDGLIYEYGNTADSQVLSVAQSMARVWAVNKISDRAGNAMLFTYEEDTTNGSFRIKDIAYTSNGASLPARYKVTFFYEALPVGERYLTYQANGIIKRITRADRIEVSFDNVLVRKYELTYETALSNTSKSRLASIQACANTVPLECLPATTFSYQNGTPGLGAEVNSPNNLPLVSPLLLDVNGDGRKDMVYSSSVTPGAGTWKLALANSSGNFDAATNASSSAVTNSDFTKATPIDYNADGREDLLLPQPSTTTWWVMLGTATGLATPVDTEAPLGIVRAVDINGDGWQDLVYMYFGGGYAGGDYIHYRLREPLNKFAASTVNIVGPLPVDSKLNDAFGDGFGGGTPDFNGDGRGDVQYRYTFRIFNPEFQAYDATTRLVVFCSGEDGQIFHTNASTSTAPFLGDMNGDGRTDLVYSVGGLNSTYRMRLSTGRGFTAEIPGPNVDDYDFPGVLLDWDGDGSDDLLLQQMASDTLYLFRSLGDGLAPPVSIGITNAPNLFSVWAADVNGDGLKDLSYYDNANANRWSVRLHNGAMPDLLTGVTDGFGMTTAFAYSPLTTADHQRCAAFPSSCTAPTAPEQDYIGGGLYVVSTMTGSTAVASSPTFTKTYAYRGSRMNITGRSFLGFEQIRSQDSRNQIWEYSDFNRTFPYIGTLSQQRIYKSNQTTLIGRVEQRWAKLDFTNAPESPTTDAPRSFPYIDKTTTTQYEIDGDQLATVVQEVLAVDPASGTFTDIKTTTTELATANGVQNGAIYEERVLHPSLTTNISGSNWCLGMPLQTQLINAHNQNSGASITRTISRTWDTVKCRLNSETLQPSDLHWEVVTALTYDDAVAEADDPDVGHVTKVEVTGKNMTTRVTKMNWEATGRFLKKVSLLSTITPSPLWEVTEYEWSEAQGLLEKTIDPNSFSTEWTYDNFGRRVSEKRPDGTSTTWSFNRCSGTSCLANSSLRWYLHQTEFAAGGGMINSADKYFDAAGRVRYEDNPTLTGSSRVVNTYDTLGRLTEQTLPHAVVGTTYLQAFGYDVANRVISITRPVSASDATPHITLITYDGLTTTVQDALNRSEVRVQNVWGLMARSQDAAGYHQNFAYDAFANLKSVTDNASPSNTLQTIGYNVVGMRTSMSDMDMGSWTYQPNALGEVEYIRDAKTTDPAWTTGMTFDLIGRMKTRTDVAENVTSTFVYGSTTPSIGRLTSITGGGHSETFAYETAAGRLQTRTISADSSSHLIDYSYNALGLLDVLQYPTSTSGYRFAVKYEYTNGFASSVKDNQAGTVFWQASASDAFGNVTSERLGNGLQTSRGFDAVTGLIGSIQTTNSAGQSIQNLTYAWDKVGNLTERRDVRQNPNLRENFFYDNLNRLDCSTLHQNAQPNCSQNQNLDLTYNQLGNITYKSNAGGTGLYTYHATKKHAVTGIGGVRTFGYDANGNVNSRDGQSISWYSYNLPNLINGAGGSSSQFYYTAERERWKQVASYGGTPETTIYIGGLVEKVTLGAVSPVTSWRHYVVGGAGPVAIYTRKSTGTNELHYVTRDHLGSIDSITDANGAAEVRLSFGSFGERRNEAGWSGNPPPADWTEITDATRRGFTFHEMLDNLNLTHMNGRVYDQLAGRFLSADPFIPSPGFTQSFNRYSYVFNSPLSYTDPSGFMPSPDDPVNPPGPKCMAVCFDPGFPPDFIGGGKRVPHGRPVPRIPLRDGAKSVPVSGLECDMGVCGSAQKLGTAAPSLGRIAVSVGVGFIPVLGSVQSVVELLSGRDYITGEKTSRALAAVGILAGLVGAKGLLKAASKADDIVEGVADVARRTCCFVAGTLVMTDSGLRPIEEIEVGDRVLSRDDVTGETAYKPVTELIRRHDREIWEVKLSVEDGSGAVEVFETTDDHPWRTSDDQWLPTENLSPGVRVNRVSGEPAVVVSVIKTDRVALTYNLEIADFHTYFVGTSGIWVHNACRLADATIELLRSLGRNVVKNPLEGVAGAGRQGDVLIDGIKTEIKNLDAGATSSTVLNVLNESAKRGGQAREIIIDARGSGLGRDQAEAGLLRAFGLERLRTAYDRITVIGDDFFFGKMPP